MRVIRDYIFKKKTDTYSVTPIVFRFNATASIGNTMPLYTSLDGSAQIDWGDGNQTYWDSSNPIGKTHMYASTGVYEVSISALDCSFDYQLFNSQAERVLEILDWGSVEWTYINFYNGVNLTATNCLGILHTSKITSFFNLFRGCSSLTTVNNITLWDISPITFLSATFINCSKFNQDLNGWDTSNVTSFYDIFTNCQLFNGEIGLWNTSSVINFGDTFRGCLIFNKDISGWNTSSATSFYRMFYQARKFNQDISNWDTSKVNNFQECFYDARVFNNNITTWDTSNATTMKGMFRLTRAFNQSIGNWNVSKLRNTSLMFNQALAFNSSLNNWGLTMAALLDISSMFSNSIFNQPLDLWKTSTITNMFGLGVSGDFNQDLSNWDFVNVGNFGNPFLSRFNTANYDLLLIALANTAVLTNVTMGMNVTKYTLGGSAEVAHNYLTDTLGWNITDGGGI